MAGRQGLRHDKALALAGLPPGPLQPRNTGASDKPPPPQAGSDGRRPFPPVCPLIGPEATGCLAPRPHLEQPSWKSWEFAPRRQQGLGAQKQGNTTQHALAPTYTSMPYIHTTNFSTYRQSHAPCTVTRLPPTCRGHAPMLALS